MTVLFLKLLWSFMTLASGITCIALLYQLFQPIDPRVPPPL
jgi:hypothetical protein